MYNGVVKETLGFFGLVVGVVCAFLFMEEAYHALKAFFEVDPAWLPLAAFAGIFFTIMLLTQILIFLLNSALKHARLTGIAHILGFAVGALKMGILLSLLLLL
ncbi:CvpA family protein, partial [Arthrospira platensis SPKY1]|nr:CvpA family protein [Arthrospira platensis SPKY1]